MRHRFAWMTALTLLAVATPGTAGLTWYRRDLSGMSYSWRTGKIDRLGFKAPAARNRYVAMAGTSRQRGYGYVPLLRALRAPFRWEVTVGVPAADRAPTMNEGDFGTELVNGDLGSWRIRAHLTATGVNVFATDGQSYEVGSRSFQGAHSIDLAVEADAAGTMTFQAREEGVGNFVDVGTTPAPSFQLFPVLSAYAFARPSLVGFDKWRVVASAPVPGTDAASQALQRIYDAYDTGLAALHELDSSTAVPSDIEATLASTIPALDDAAAKLSPLANGNSSTAKTALNKVQAARRKIAAAVATLSHGKPALSVFATVAAALNLELEAATPLVLASQ